MRSPRVVEVQISGEARAGLRDAVIGMQVDLLVFDRPPETFDEDVVAPSSLQVELGGQFAHRLIALQRRQCDLRFERGAVVSSRTSCHLSLLLPGIAAGSGADNPPNSPVQIS